MKTKYFLTVFISVVALGGILIWREIFVPKDFQFKENKTFSVEKGQNVSQIAGNLKKEGIIRNKFFFDLYLILTKNTKKIQAGKYLLDSTLAIPEIARKFVLGETIKIKVTIPEGFNLKQIKKELEANFKEADLSKFSIIEFKNEFDFFKDVPASAPLEGFLFPDTYFFEPDTERKDIARIFLKNFSGKLGPDLKEEIKKQDKSIFEIITMASLIEKEVRTIEDKKIVSGIFWKRLKTGKPLESCATIAYVLGVNKWRYSFADTRIESPYNTYLNQGLPPGPVSNPGLESILAAIYPQESDYWYYLSKPDGETVFSRTLGEHNAAIKKYLNK